MMKKIFGLLLGVVCAILFTACTRAEEVPENSWPVYYLSKFRTKVETGYTQMQATEPERQIEELLNCLKTVPEKTEYKAPLNMGFEVISTMLDNGTLTIDVESAYKELPVTTQVLVRAAIVRTLTQVSAVKYVLMTVDGEPLYDNNGDLVGRMNADQFIVNDGNAINTHELARLRLYFADESGTALISGYREKHYSTNIPLERLVVEELIAGPTGELEGLYPSINPNTEIINITTKDNICYVNLDENFLTVVNNVSTEVSIYSIVNSLVGLSNITKVQILVNGEIPPMFSSVTYSRNLDIVTILDK